MLQIKRFSSRASALFILQILIYNCSALLHYSFQFFLKRLDSSFLINFNFLFFLFQSIETKNINSKSFFFPFLWSAINLTMKYGQNMDTKCIFLHYFRKNSLSRFLSHLDSDSREKTLEIQNSTWSCMPSSYGKVCLHWCNYLIHCIYAVCIFCSAISNSKSL